MQPRPNAIAVPSVILRHDTPDGGSHLDWMILRESGLLMTFRVASRPDEAGGAFEGVGLADHRAIYLDFEGEISGGRGRVTRVARGVVAVVESSGARVVIEGGYGGARMRWIGSRVEGDRWVFERMPI